MPISGESLFRIRATPQMPDSTNGRYDNLFAQGRTSLVVYSQVAEIGALFFLSRRCKLLSTYIHAHEFRNQPIESALECVRHGPCVSNTVLYIRRLLTGSKAASPPKEFLTPGFSIETRLVFGRLQRFAHKLSTTPINIDHRPVVCHFSQTLA
jgi:hypothetical protein